MISGIFGVQRLDPSKFRRKQTIQFKKKKLKYEFKRIFALYALAVLSFFSSLFPIQCGPELTKPVVVFSTR
jgi:hypothetical protein